jgi:hypothetical protein
VTIILIIMGKQNKRARKFLAKGGVQGRIEKGGTIVKKGKIHHNTNKRKADDKEQDASSRPNVNKKTVASSGDNSGDLLSAKNIANLDMDSFFSTVSLALEEEEQQQHAGAGSEEDDDEDDSDDSETEESSSPPPAKKKKKMTTSTKNSKNDSASVSSKSDDDDSSSGGSDDEDVVAAEREEGNVQLDQIGSRISQVFE